MKENLFGVCPYVTTQKLLAGKWSIYILYLLTQEPLRFNELQRRMPEDMTHTSLSRQLKQLEKEGLIIRKDYQQIPPKVEYILSPVGEKFRSVLDEIEVWGELYIKQMKEKIDLDWEILGSLRQWQAFGQKILGTSEANQAQG